MNSFFCSMMNRRIRPKREALHAFFLAALNGAHRTNGPIENGSVERKLNQEQSEITDDNQGEDKSRVSSFLFFNAINTLNTFSV